jgi:hypothetical protein
MRKEIVMRGVRAIRDFGLSLAVAGSMGVVAWAVDPFWGCPHVPCPPAAPMAPAAPGQPAPGQPAPGQPAPGQPSTDQTAPQTPDNAFAQAPAAGTGAESTGNPNILGDFPSVGVSKFRGRSSSSYSSGSSSQSSSAKVAVIHGGSLKFAENENVLPTSRFFLTYNGYSNVLPGVNDTAGATKINYQYETAGVEASFLDGNASLGLRMPLFELSGPANPYQTRVGDVSLVSKFLLASDGPGGDALSAGLVVTLPTGLQPTDVNGRKIHSTVFQPWWGFVTNLSDDIYFQGFNSLAIPSTRRDAKIMFIDAAVGYWAYRGEAGGLVTGIVPTSEIHINWVWTNRGEPNAFTTHAISVPTSVDLTEGVHILFGRASLQLGVSFSVTGPKLYDVEGIAQLNLPF